MQIAEVPIEAKAVKRKKYSAKTKMAAEAFLDEIDLRIEDLDNEQKRHILDHIKLKRTIKWCIPFMIIMLFINLALIFGYKHILYEITDFFLEPHANVEVIEEDGSTSYKEMTEQEIEILRNYGLVCGMISSSMTILLFSAITGLTGGIAWVFKARKQEKIFKAFLPALKTASSTINPKFVTHNS